MAEVTGFTADRMLAMEDATVVDGSIVGDDLILTTKDGTPINAGDVRGPQGDKGDIGDVNQAQLAAEAARIDSNEADLASQLALIQGLRTDVDFEPEFAFVSRIANQSIASSGGGEEIEFASTGTIELNGFNHNGAGAEEVFLNAGSRRGFYFVGCKIESTGILSTGGVVACGIRINNTGDIMVGQEPHAQLVTRLTCNGIALLEPGDEMTMWVYHNKGSALNFRYARMWAFMLRPVPAP